MCGGAEGTVHVLVLHGGLACLIRMSVTPCGVGITRCVYMSDGLYLKGLLTVDTHCTMFLA